VETPVNVFNLKKFLTFGLNYHSPTHIVSVLHIFTVNFYLFNCSRTHTQRNHHDVYCKLVLSLVMMRETEMAYGAFMWQFNGLEAVLHISWVPGLILGLEAGYVDW